MADKTWIENIKMLCELLAFFSAACFFLFKAISGVFYVSLGLKLTLSKRMSISDTQDLLLVAVELSGGENAFLNLHQIQGRAIYNEHEHLIEFNGIERLCTSDNKNTLEVEKPWKAWKADKYRIGIKETTSFCEKVSVPKNAVCKIEVVVVGRRRVFFFFKTKSQWRASAISLPNLNSNKQCDD